MSSIYMTDPQTRQTLLQSAAIVRKGWCTGAPAKDAEGKSCGPRDKRAVSWCAIGAIQKICGGTENGFEARYALRQVIGRHEIADWNDTYAQSGEMVATMMEEAAKYAVGRSHD